MIDINKLVKMLLKVSAFLGQRHFMIIIINYSLLLLCHDLINFSVLLFACSTLISAFVA